MAVVGAGPGRPWVRAADASRWQDELDLGVSRTLGRLSRDAGQGARERGDDQGWSLIRDTAMTHDTPGIRASDQGGRESVSTGLPERHRFEHGVTVPGV